MASHTDLADINEIMMGYYLNGEKWFDPEAKRQYEAKMKRVSPKEAQPQIEKARAMAKEVLKWAKANKYSGLKKVYWTARPGSLQRAVDPQNKMHIDSRKNPTDILLEFQSGPSDGFLGVSAKSTKGSTDIGFKNPGMGTIEKNLKINLSDIVDKNVKKAIKTFGLSENNNRRKLEIRASKKIQEKTVELGQQTLNEIRDELFKKLSKMQSDALRQYVLTDWMNADELHPPYIKVTGMGNKPPYTAKVENPLKSEKMEYLNKHKLKVEKVGNDSVGVSAGPKKLLKMRAKFESEKLASSVKFSGDPW